MNKLWRVVVLAVVSLSAIALPACNTIEGAGRDIERGGEHLQDAAK